MNFLRLSSHKLTQMCAPKNVCCILRFAIKFCEAKPHEKNIEFKRSQEKVMYGANNEIKHIYIMTRNRPIINFFCVNFITIVVSKCI